MELFLGIRREDKNIWERRSPLTPLQVKELSDKYNLKLCLQPSQIRAYSDSEYEALGASVTEDLSKASVIIGVKEMPPDFFKKGNTYVFFSHTIKGQKSNMEMLKKLLEKECQLIDYEKIVDQKGKRLIFFGNFAGLAGMIDTLWGLGKRLDNEGIKNPFTSIEQCYKYGDLKRAKEAIKKISKEIEENGLPEEICPLVCGFAGYGHVSKGAQEIFDLLPHIKVSPEELPSLSKENCSKNHLYKVIFEEKHMVTPVDENMIFELSHYYKFPEYYKPQFHKHVPYLTVLLNCIYWDKKYARLITKDYVKSNFSNLKLKIIGDISCDINGAIEFTEEATTPSEPLFIYDPVADTISHGCNGRGIAVMSIDNLPCELPRDSSEFFGSLLKDLIPEIVRADYTVDFDKCNLPSEIKKAVIVYRGKLTPDYKYLEKYI